MSVQSNAAEKIRRLEELRHRLPEFIGPTAKANLMNVIAADGKDMLVQMTDAAIAQPRWELSGQAGRKNWNLTDGNPVDRAWRIKEVNVGDGTISWRNPNPIFKFLDQGTRAHGPVRAKMLFIPLKREVAKAYLDGTLFVQEGRAIIPTKRKRGKVAVTALTRAMGAQGSFRKLEWGVDFILKNWVAGIQARHIVEDFEKKFLPVARKRFREWVDETKAQIRGILQGA